MKKKCKVVRGTAYPCFVLKDATDGTRLRHTEIISMSNGLRTGSIVVGHSGKFRAKGIVYNYCPFCGVRLYAEAGGEK